MPDQKRDRAVWKGEALSRIAMVTVIGIVLFAVIGAVVVGLAF